MHERLRLCGCAVAAGMTWARVLHKKNVFWLAAAGMTWARVLHKKNVFWLAGYWYGTKALLSKNYQSPSAYVYVSSRRSGSRATLV